MSANDREEEPVASSGSIDYWSDDDFASISDHSDDVDDAIFTRHAEEGPSWQTPQPALFSMEPPVGQTELREELSKTEDWAIYEKVAILDTSAEGITNPWIRLLQIEPDFNGQPLRCKLVRRPLWDAGEYFALSYSWGKEPKSSKIYVGSQANPFSVSLHLWSALNRLRHLQHYVAVWVDAICIHQQNIIERAAQVQIMAQIFNQASEVRVWLGEIDGSEEGKVLPDFEIFWSLCLRPSPWWKRLWIIQECAYAEICPIVMLGGSVMSFEQLIERWEAAIPTDRDNLEQESLWNNIEFLRMPFRAWTAQKTSNNHRLPLLQRLRETEGRQCTEPHDRIYAMLSLIDENEARQLKPDYRKSFLDLMIEVFEVLRQSPSWNERSESDVLRILKLDYLEETVLSHEKTAYECGEALDEAIIKGDTNVVRLLLSKLTSFSDSKSYIDHAFQVAVKTDYVAIFKLLIDAGADVGAPKEGHRAALHEAAMHANVTMMESLIDAGANCNIPRGYYDLALSAASAKGLDKVVKVLLDVGVNIKSLGRLYEDALYAASEGGCESVVKTLLDAGAVVNSNALYVASEGGYEKIVQMLIDSGGNVNGWGGRYLNPIWVASIHGHEKVVKMLLEAGASVKTEGGLYDQVLFLASSKGYERVVKMLKDARADTASAPAALPEPSPRV